MGTRNLTMIIDQQGEVKVAQYGQWDGYPSGVGAGVLKFLNNNELFNKLVQNLSKCIFLDEEGIDKVFIESYNKNAPEWSNQPDNRTEEQIRWFTTYCHRDLAEEVLINIAESTDEEIILLDRRETATNDGWVEWSYVINLKDNKLFVHEHIDKPALKEFDLNNLPDETEFVKVLEGEPEEEED